MCFGALVPIAITTTALWPWFLAQLKPRSMWASGKNSLALQCNRYVLGVALFCLSLVSISAAADSRIDYLLHCAGCHLENGSGSPPDVPDMRETLGFLASSADGRAYLVRVPGASFAPISDAALAEVINYMLSTFVLKQEGAALYTEEEVAANRHEPLYNPQILRDTLLESL